MKYKIKWKDPAPNFFIIIGDKSSGFRILSCDNEQEAIEIKERATDEVAREWHKHINMRYADYDYLCYYLGYGGALLSEEEWEEREPQEKKEELEILIREYACGRVSILAREKMHYFISENALPSPQVHGYLDKMPQIEKYLDIIPQDKE